MILNSNLNNLRYREHQNAYMTTIHTFSFCVNLRALCKLIGYVTHYLFHDKEWREWEAWQYAILNKIYEKISLPSCVVLNDWNDENSSVICPWSLCVTVHLGFALRLKSRAHNLIVKYMFYCTFCFFIQGTPSVWNFFWNTALILPLVWWEAGHQLTARRRPDAQMYSRS